MNNKIGLINLALTIAGFSYFGIQFNAQQSQTEQLIKDVEINVERRLTKDIRNLKPETHQEILVQSDRLMGHAGYIADQFYGGNIMHPNVVRYVDVAYDSVMENQYNNAFYSKLQAIGRYHPTIEPYTINESGERDFDTPSDTPDGVKVRGKYFIDTKENSIFANLIARIPTSFLLMKNDVIPFPDCQEGETPIAIYGELYTEDSLAYGVELKTELNGWRIGLKGVHPADATGLENRVVYQSACRSAQDRE